MKNKVFYLSTCSTCKNIMKAWPLESLALQDLKKESINAEELDFLQGKVGSYEELLNKRARLLGDHKLSSGAEREQEIRSLILSHYSFLKRPILVLNNDIFVGNSSKIVEAAKQSLSKQD